MSAHGLVLSLFPGVGLLDAAFEAEGFCVVRGPDRWWGGDIRSFVPPRGRFDGIIGGPPCQDFSSARRCAPTGDGLAMLEEFKRVVAQTQVEWWLAENVDAVPDLRIDGYSWQRVDVEQAWFCSVRRLRHIQFGSRSRRFIEIPRGKVRPGAERAALASDRRSLDELKRLQGLPASWDLPGMTHEAKKTAVGNGVPFVLGRVLARAVRAAYTGAAWSPLFGEDIPKRRCACGCGRPVTARASSASPRCRKRLQRLRETPAVVGVTELVQLGVTGPGPRGVTVRGRGVCADGGLFCDSARAQGVTPVRRPL